MNYIIYKRTEEIGEKKEIKPLCVTDEFQEEIEIFKDLEKAKKELKKYSSEINEYSVPTGKIYMCTEYVIVDEENSIIDNTIFKINVIIDYEEVASFDNMIDALEYYKQEYEKDETGEKDIYINFN